MKKAFAKTMAMALASVFFLSSCNSASKQEPVSGTNAGSTAASGAADTKTESLPEANLTVEVFDRGDLPAPSTAESNILNEWIKAKVKEDLNINLTFVPIPRSQEYDKLNVMMAGNTAPDIVFSYNVAVPSEYAKNGGLTDLTPYIDQYGSNIKKELAAQLPYGVFFDKQFAIPANRVNEDLKHSTWIRKDILDKNNLQVPTTLADFYNALKAVKANDPDMIPYAMATTKNERYYENIVMSFVNYKDEKEFYMYNSDNTRLLSPGTKEGFREINKWYNEGLISKDFALDDNSKQFNADIANGKAFAFTDDLSKPFGEPFPTVYKDVPGVDFVMTNTFANSKGEYFYNKYAPIGMYIMVPKASEKNAAAAVRYLNWMLEKENLYTVKAGVDLGFAKINEDGSTTLLKTPQEIEAMGFKDTLYTDLGIIKSKIDYGSKEVFEKVDINSFTRDYWDATSVVQSMYKAREGKGFYESPRLPYVTDADSKYGANIRSAVQTMAAKVIACPVDQFDTVWDAEISQIKGAGLDKVLEQREAAYDEMKK